MRNIKEIIRVGVILFVITAISSLLLAYANSITSPIIEENTRIKTEQSMKTVLSTADSFEKVEVDMDGITEVYSGMSNNELKGVCIISEVNGYGGAIKVITAVDTDKKVTGIDILTHSETPGLGAKAVSPEFKEQFAGKEYGITVVKNTAKDNEIQAISGATITSNAVTEAVNISLSAADDIYKQLN